LLLNRHDLDYSVQKLGVAPENAQIISNGIPESFLNLPFEPTPTLCDSSIGIALIASYIPRKGICYSVPALNSILSRYPQVKVSFLGTLTPEKEVHKDFEETVRDRVRVIPHFNHNMLPHLLKDHQIKLFPSLSEGFSLALPEAMACGLAPVAASIPGVTDILKDGDNGILITPRNSFAIQEALEKLINDRTLLERLRSNAYNTAQHYSWGIVAQHQISLYEEALEKRKPL
jgi:glycosyltransferase involved in cell wall biosynthesis